MSAHGRNALSVVVNAQADALRNGWTSSAKPEISTGHHNPITPQDRDAVPETLLCVELAVAVIPFLTTALFTAGRHHDDFML